MEQARIGVAVVGPKTRIAGLGLVLGCIGKGALRGLKIEVDFEG